MLQLKKLQPRRFIPGIAIAWGAVSLCTGFVQNKTQMIAVRLLLYGYKPLLQLSSLSRVLAGSNAHAGDR